MSAASDLQDAYDNLAAAYKAATLNPCPNYNIDGQQVAFADYMKSLLDQMNLLRQAMSDAEGPFEFPMIGTT